MVSKAAISAQPLHVCSLSDRVPKKTPFHRAMEAQGAARRFEGEIGRWSDRPLDEAGRIAHILGARHLR